MCLRMLVSPQSYWRWRGLACCHFTIQVSNLLPIMRLLRSKKLRPEDVMQALHEVQVYQAVNGTDNMQPMIGRSLQTLHLEHCKRLRDDRLAMLAPFTSTLQVLSLNTCSRLTPRAAQHLTNLTCLTRLDLSGSSSIEQCRALCTTSMLCWGNTCKGGFHACTFQELLGELLQELLWRLGVS